MFKRQIVLKKMSEVRQFLDISLTYPAEGALQITNEDHSRIVSATSLLGILYSLEWDGKVYLESTIDDFKQFERFLV